MKKLHTHFKSYISALKIGFAAHAPLLIFVTFYALLTLAVTSLNFLNSIVTGALGYLFLIVCFVTMLLIVKAVAVFIHMIFVIKPKRPIQYWYGELKSFLSIGSRLPYALPLLLGFFLFTISFSELKSHITAFKPFTYDFDLYQLDLWLHFGKLPSEWLHDVLSHPFWAALLNYNYNLWFFLVIYSFFLACFGKSYYKLGIRYIIASMLLWAFAGNGLAIIFSSAGPCYYGLIGLDNDPYISLMGRLQLINDAYSPLMALDVQKMLWDNYQNSGGQIAQGISAFPSLHVASAVLLARAGFVYRSLVGWILSIFALLILVGSIYLGWHYAVDGYIAVLLAFIAWWISEPISKWYFGRRAFQGFKS